MHACLLLDEILEYVIQYAHADDPKSSVALAQACKLFSEPALNAIWYRLATLLPLFKCLPSDAIEVAQLDPQTPRWFRNGGSDVIRMKRDTTTPEWARFRFYASRVKILVPYKPWALLDGPLFLYMQSHFRHILPNLRKAAYYLHSENVEAMDWDLLVSPKLREITFSSGTAAPAASVAALNAMASRVDTGLVSLTIHTHDRDLEALRKSVTATTIRFGRLEEFNFSSIALDGSALKHLASNRHLAHASFMLGSDNAIISLHQDEDFFSGLRVLRLANTSLALAACFIRRVQSAQLSDIAVDVAWSSTFASDLTHFMETLALHGAARCIKRLRIDRWRTGDGHPHGQPPPEAIVSAAAIKALSSLTSLTHLEFRCGRDDAFTLSDDLLIEFANAHPGLVALDMCSRSWSHPEINTLSFRGIAHLASTCRHLIELNITFDGTIPVDNGVALIPNQRVKKKMRLGASPVSADASSVARVMKALFPGVYQFYPQLGSSEEARMHISHWAAVSALL